MFHGTTTAPVRAYLARELKAVKPKRLFEPFAGIFMVSQITGMVSPETTVLSSEVSLYSVAIGCGLAGRAAPIKAKPLLAETFPALAGYTTPVQMAAIIIFMAEAAIARKKAGKTPYYETLFHDLQIRSTKYVDDIVKQVEKAKAHMPKDFQFHASDGVALLEQAQAGDFVFYDPPFYSGDYEKMFAALDDYFEMESIPYTNVTSDLKNEHLAALAAKGCHVYYRCEAPIEIPGFELVFRAEYKFNGAFLVYANKAVTRGLIRHEVMQDRAKPYLTVMPTTEITQKSKVQIVPVPSPVANHYRLQWTKKANMRDLSKPYLFTIDGRVAGVIVIETGRFFGTSYALIVSDCTTTATSYRKLSKLLLLCILTDEFRKVVNDAFMWEHEGFTTIAYTDHDSSMKYRGLFELAEKQKGEDGVEGKKYKLLYRTKTMRNPTIKGAFQQWFQKHSNDRHATNPDASEES